MEIMIRMGKNNKINNYYAFLPFLWLQANVLTAPTSLNGINKLILSLVTYHIILLFCIVNIVGIKIHL